MKKIWAITIITLLVSIAGVFFWQQINYQHSLAHLYVNVEGSTTEIYLNEQKIGQAPIKDYQIISGFYQLKIVTDNYSYQTTLRLSPQTATIIDWQATTQVENSSGVIYELLKLDNQQQTQLLINTIPDRSVLTFSHSRQTEFSPYQTDQIAAGNYQVALSLPGYDNLNFPFTITPGYQLKITAKLAQTFTE